MKQVQEADLRSVDPNNLWLIQALPGLIGIVRDQDFRLIWCTSAFYPGLISDSEIADIAGTTLHDIYSPSTASAREALHREVMETGEVRSQYMFLADMRVLCTVFPLDEEAFGYKGVMVIIRESAIGTQSENGRELSVDTLPNLDQLGVLSTRELEVLHYIALGMSTGSIAQAVTRSSKTVEKQVNSIHTKLGTHSRAELVRFASERGLQSFSSSQWSQIAQGARIVRRERGRDRVER